jgi:putative tryptophan/tyrosine transport system substrate-binding protein
LKEIAPRVTRAAVLLNRAASMAQLGAIQGVAPSFGVEVSSIDLRDAGEVEQAISAFAGAPNGGLILTGAGSLAATAAIPIVFTSGTDPVKEGLVKSLNRPGGNATGSYVFTTSLGPKRLELLGELVPHADRIAFLVNPNSEIADIQVKEVVDAAPTFGLQVHVLNASTKEELDRVFVVLVQRRAGALLMSAYLFFQVQRDQLVALAARHSLPVMYEWPEFVRAGGLVSYSTFRSDAFLQSGIYVGRILNGAKVADLPLVQSTRFELTINLKAAKAINFQIPAKLLALADEVIE